MVTAIDLGTRRATDGPAIEHIEARAFRIPTDRPEADGTLAWEQTTVVVVLVEAAGCAGTGWTYGSDAAASVVSGDDVQQTVVGADALDVAAVHEQIVRALRNIGRPGIAGCALSAVDVALWDLKARLLGLPVASLMGHCRSGAPVYGSGGFTTYDDETTSAQVEGWLSEGIERVKIKVGESWGTAEARDRHRVALVRSVVGDGAEVFVDANGGYSVKQAVRVGRAMAEESGITWFEEPVSSDDLAGLAAVRAQVPADVAAGEYGYTESYFSDMARAGAVDCLQIDATRCGGYTSWLRAAAIAAACGLEVSGHCAPHLHVPVACSVPNLRHVEFFHDHRRTDNMLFDGLPSLVGGSLVPDTGSPGHGMTLRSDATQFRVR